MTEGRIYFRDRLYVPPIDELRLQAMSRTHSAAPGGHPGRFKTLELMRRSYWWPNLSRDVAAFVKGCHLCARTKSSRTAPPGFLDPLPVPFKPWSDISVDLVGPLPECQRHGQTFENVMVVVDRLTKMRHYVAMTSTESEALAVAFVSSIYRLHGTPSHILSDRGPQFVSRFWRSLSARLGVVLKHSSAFHPETDGQTEVVNAEVPPRLLLLSPG